MILFYYLILISFFFCIFLHRIRKQAKTPRSSLATSSFIFIRPTPVHEALFSKIQRHECPRSTNKQGGGAAAKLFVEKLILNTFDEQENGCFFVASLLFGCVWLLKTFCACLVCHLRSSLYAAVLYPMLWVTLCTVESHFVLFEATLCRAIPCCCCCREPFCDVAS